MRLLIVSDSPALVSGQARVVRELAGRFHAAAAEVTVAGWFHDLVPDPPAFPYLVLPTPKHQQREISTILDALKPDTVLAIGDPWDFAYLARVRAATKTFMLVGYLNIEASPIPPQLEVVLDGFDVLTTTSEFGAKVIGRPRVRAIHHGVDRGTFHPVPKLPMLFGRKLDSTFVVLLNGQNVARKNLPVALQGFARFAADKRDVLCYVNAERVPVPGAVPGFDLGDVVVQEGIRSKVVFNPANHGPLDTIDDPSLNATYGIADVLLVTSIAEGFCLPLLEAMATHTVPIAPAAYSSLELIGNDRGVLIPVGAHMRGDRGTDTAIVSADAVATALQTVYDDWREVGLGGWHRRGMAFAMSHSWDRTYEQLCEAIAGGAQRDRVATGGVIDPYLRLTTRQAIDRHSGSAPIGVLKLGGLGDMLQTTTVVRAAHFKTRRRVMVFCNSHPEIFRAMPEVAEVIEVRSAPQDVIVRSVADLFESFFDVRYVSRAFGEPPNAFADRHRFFYDGWIEAVSRLADLKMHSTDIMLTSLGLVEAAMMRGRDALRPIFETRVSSVPVSGDYIAVASGASGLGELKQWPLTSWRDLVNDIGMRVCQVGGAEDPAIEGALDARGRSLAETAAIIEGAVAFVGVESGIAHLAAAVGTRSVVLFGPTSPVLFGYPWNVNLTAEKCSPCWWGPGWEAQTCAIAAKSCLNLVSVARVLQAVSLIVDAELPKVLA